MIDSGVLLIFMLLFVFFLMFIGVLLSFVGGGI